jgi:hypothetical protein
MSEIDWTSVYQGRVLHGFTGEAREVKNKRTIPSTILEYKTLCGKWFNYPRKSWTAGSYNHGKPRCKKCLAKMEVE